MSNISGSPSHAPPPPPLPPRVIPPGPPPCPAQAITHAIPIRNKSTSEEEECKRRLTTHEAHTIRKIILDSRKSNSTWAKSEITRELLAPQEVSKQIKKLGEGKRSITDKKKALQPLQLKQVDNLLDELNAAERDPLFEYSLVQIDQKVKLLKTGQQETTTITCYVKRAPRKDVNPVSICNALERQKAERLAAVKRPPQQPQPPQQGNQPREGPGPGPGPGPGIVKLDPGDSKNRPSRLPRPRKRSGKRYYDSHSSVSSGFSSDTHNASGYSSSEGTSMSSRSMSDQHQIRDSNHKGRHRSRSRVRNGHRRSQYFIDEEHDVPTPSYVPDVPRGIPSVPALDPVAAAYQAGRIDADAERFGFDRVPRVHPVADRAVVSYGRPEPRYPEPRYDSRYIDEFDDLRYVSRRASKPRGIYAIPNPFAPGQGQGGVGKARQDEGALVLPGLNAPSSSPTNISDPISMFDARDPVSHPLPFPPQAAGIGAGESIEPCISSQWVRTEDRSAVICVEKSTTSHDDPEPEIPRPQRIEFREAAKTIGAKRIEALPYDDNPVASNDKREILPKELDGDVSDTSDMSVSSVLSVKFMGTEIMHAKSQAVMANVMLGIRNFRQHILDLWITTIAIVIWKRKTLKLGNTRIEWRCKCGHNISDDFTELQPGAAQRLRHTLNHSSETARLKDSAFVGIIRGISDRFRSVCPKLTTTSNVAETSLPFHETSSPATQPGNNEPAPSDIPAPEPLFLLICYSEGRYATKLLQLDLIIQRANSDKSLFKLLRENYTLMRRSWISWISLRALKSIKFVHFEMYKSALVDVRKTDDIPPPGHIDYRYAPVPPEIIPPVGEQHLLHLFQYPDCADDESICVGRFPKKLRERLQCKRGVNHGWGLQFVEGWDWKKIWIISSSLFALGSLLTGILWSVYEHSVQDAFAISSYIVALGTLSIGTSQALLIM